MERRSAESIAQLRTLAKASRDLLSLKEGQVDEFDESKPEAERVLENFNFIDSLRKEIPIGAFLVLARKTVYFHWESSELIINQFGIFYRSLAGRFFHEITSEDLATSWQSGVRTLAGLGEMSKRDILNKFKRSFRNPRQL